jgi:7-alpha-hydroxysteroid dehydrogenase
MNADPSAPGRFAGRVAVVTGASRGIGRCVAAALAAQGASVAIAARTAEGGTERLPGSLQEVVGEIRARGGRAMAVACDVADPGDLQRLVDETQREFGTVDIVVNNAALTVPDRRAPSTGPRAAPLDPRERLSIRNFPLSAYRRAFEVNLFGPYELMRLTIPGMVGLGRGNVVNISSDAAHVPSEGPYPANDGIPLHAYGNSKAALEHLTRTVAYELAGAGVAVNAVLPSRPIETPGTLVTTGGTLGDTLDMARFVEAVLRLCAVSAAERTGAVLYSEDILDESGRRRGWLGDPYL